MNGTNPGTLAGAGSFRCESCGFTVALDGVEHVPACPSCGSQPLRRTALHDTPLADGGLADAGLEWLESARAELLGQGDYVAFEDERGAHAIRLRDGWTRLGRSLSAHVRLDDATVSRRHALLYRDEEGVRILDDRSLNGVFRNGERVDHALLVDGDEIAIGCYRLRYLTVGRPTTGRAARADRAVV